MTKILTATRFVIVDDHPLMRDGLAMRLSSQPDWIVCGEAATEDDGFKLIQTLCPDVVIIDIALKIGNGIELIKRVKAAQISAKMLTISAFQESLYAERAMRAGAHGYLNKQETNDQLIEAIRVILKGERYLSPEMTQRMVSQALGNRSENQDPRELLSDRELEIFRLIGAGVTTGAIADRLFLSTHTIDTHRENIKRKLGAKTGAELSRVAIHAMLEGH
jgi:DNA-binding NarL/FixJ family response regulator